MLLFLHFVIIFNHTVYCLHFQCVQIFDKIFKMSSYCYFISYFE